MISHKFKFFIHDDYSNCKKKVRTLPFIPSIGMTLVFSTKESVIVQKMSYNVKNNIFHCSCREKPEGWNG